jgi:ABC-type glycerol-3-phosphate transport system substrate-binding protein
MFKNSTHKEAVWEFMKFLTSSVTQLRWDMQTGFLPIIKSVGEDQNYLNWVNVTEPRMLPFIQGMPYAHARPATPLYNQVSDAFSRGIQSALLGTASPADALAAAEKAVNEILKK